VKKPYHVSKKGMRIRGIDEVGNGLWYKRQKDLVSVWQVSV
jgi:hypothetical protein